MKLTTRCNSCKKDILIKSQANTRPELQMEKGAIFDVNCNNCGINQKKHINDIIAEPSKIMIISGILIGIFATILFWILFGIIGTVSVIIPVLFWQQQKKSVKSFNSYMIKRK